MPVPDPPQQEAPCDDPSFRLRLAERDEVEQSVAHALQFDGRRAFRASGEMMARITAAHLVEQLGRAGYVILKKPPKAAHQAPASGGTAQKDSA